MPLTQISLNSDLNNDWTLTYGPQDKNAPATPEELKSCDWPTISAAVPGNVELDLFNAGEIADPMIGNNVFDLRKYETCRWWYRRTFAKPEIPEDHRVELRFDGVDCLAEIWLNNQKIGRTENMFVEHLFDVTDHLEDENELHVCISSPILEARKYTREAFGDRHDMHAEAVYIRKAAHMYGWDILPRVVSAGLWKDVSLQIVPTTRWKSVYWVTKSVHVEEKKADMYVDWEFDTDRLNIDDLSLRFLLKRGESVIYDETIKVFTTVSRQRIWNLENVDFWFPRGFGEPALYEAILELIDSEGTVLARDTQRIGIRKAELVLSEIHTDEQPGDFYFRINGEKIFAKGTNWVALDAIHSRDREHIKPSVDMLVDLNCNMIRLWGGNVYEADEFYDLCDENGVMVWQDFAMACSTYPQDAEFAKKIEQEAAKVILRLRHHPSLVLWAGNNENDVSLEWAGDQTHIDPNTDVISRRVLPDMVRRLDPHTPYLPSSPYISPEAFKIHGRVASDVIPEQHLWGPRGYYKAPFYTETKAVFVSEIGYHGCPSRESLEKMMDAEFVYPWGKDFEWNDQWQTKAVRSHPFSDEQIKRNDLMINQIKCVFGEVPTDLDRFILASQIVQAEAKKYFVEFWRMSKFDRAGILWWNLRDGWPVISDAVVDYCYNKKLAYHYLKRVQTDVCVMIGDARDGLPRERGISRGKQHPVVVVNDTLREVAGTMAIRDADSGEILLRKSFFVEKNGKSGEGFVPASSETKLWLIEWQVDGEKFTNHYLAYQPTIALDEYLKWLPLLKPKKERS